MEALLRETHDAERRHFWYAGFRCFVRPLVAAAVATVGREQPRLLDAGCGTGTNLALLNAFGDAHGFDVTLSGLVLGRTTGARRVACATASRMPFADAAFDVVTSFDLLQCLDESTERDAVAEMFRVLRPGGAAVVSVAAFDALRGEHAVFGGEQRRYTRRRLRAALTPAGFRIERLTCSNALLFVPLLARRTWQRARGLPPAGEARSDFRQPPAVVNAMLAALLAIEAQAARFVDLPFGSTLLCLARKPRAEPIANPT